MARKTQAATVRVDLKGDKELLKKFQRLQDTTMGEEVAKVSLEGARMVRRSAIQNAPVKTGNLRSSIVVLRQVQGKRGSFSTVGTLERVHYARQIEYNWDGKYKYLRPALDSNAKQIKSMFEAAMRGAVRRF